MLNALIYSSNFIGHRQIYVYVIANILIKSGYKIHIAGNFSGNQANLPYLAKLIDNEEIIRINTFGFKGNGMQISINEILDIQKNNAINLTIFAEADNHIQLFNSQIFAKNKKFPCRTIGIFLRPFYFYQKQTLREKLRFIRRIKSVWSSDTRLFHEVLNPRFKLLDVAFYIDDYFVSAHKNTRCLPDVFQQYADKLAVEEASDERKWMQKLDEFTVANKGRIHLLYFGTAQLRRGYDVLLNLASENNACFIHCGLRNSENEKYTYNVAEIRAKLAKENRLFETNQYLTDPKSIEYFFKSVSHLILPYDNFYGSSGVMLQALGYGVPVLVPDAGIIGYRVNKFNLGMTYTDETFISQFHKFIQTPKSSFEKSIDDYMRFQSAEKLEEVLINSFTA